MGEPQEPISQKRPDNDNNLLNIKKTSHRKTTQTSRRAQKALKDKLKTVGYEEGKAIIAPDQAERKGHGAVLRPGDMAPPSEEQQRPAEDQQRPDEAPKPEEAEKTDIDTPVGPAEEPEDHPREKEQRAPSGVKVKVISVYGAGYDVDEDKHHTEDTHWKVIINMGKRHKLKKGAKVDFGKLSGKVARLYPTRALIVIKTDSVTARTITSGTLVK